MKVSIRQGGVRDDRLPAFERANIKSLITPYVNRDHQFNGTLSIDCRRDGEVAQIQIQPI
jgi:hypothetical protein